MKFSSIGTRGLLEFSRQQPQIVTQNINKLWPFYLRAFLPASLIAGHLNYTRFIVIGRSRSGSNLLRGSLMSHNGIVVFGDIFRRYDIIRWGFPFTFQSKNTVSHYQNNPVEFLDTQVFGKFPKSVCAVGFKALYPNKHRNVWDPVETYLGKQKNIKIIHIKRKNILKSHLSLKRVAKRRDQWSNISGNQTNTSDQSIHLDYEECLHAFEETREQEKKYDNLFKGQNKINVFYEDLTRNYENEVRRIQEFLEVDYQTLNPLTHKQGKKSLAEEVSNYTELVEKFSGTVWEEFFEDQPNLYPIR